MKSLLTELSILRTDILRNGEIREFVSLLQSLEDLYNHLYALSLIEQAAKEKSGTSSWNPKPVTTLSTIRNVNDVVLPEDRIRLFRVNVSSPGWLDALGKLAPLETIRKYISDRHERIKDHNYRNDAEREKLSLLNDERALNNERLKTQVIAERIEVFKDLGVPEDKIRQAMMEHFFKPVEQIDRMQDSQLIGGAKLLSQEEAESVLDNKQSQ